MGDHVAITRSDSCRDTLSNAGAVKALISTTDFGHRFLIPASVTTEDHSVCATVLLVRQRRADVFPLPATCIILIALSPPYRRMDG